MGKALKIIGGLFGLVVVLIVAAVIIVPMVVDPNDYKDEVIAKVKEQTGRTLSMPGDLKLSVFPWIAVETGKISLSNPKSFGDKPFAEVNEVSVRVKLLPLLSRKVEVDTVGLDGLNLNLIKNKKGVTNWDDLAKGSGDKEKAEPKGDDDGSAPELTIGGVDISNARVSWTDQSAGQSYKVDQFFLKTGAIVNGQPVSLEMGMNLESAAPKVSAAVTLEATIALNESAGVVEVSDLKFKVDAEGADLPGGKAQLELEAAIKAALNGSSLSVTGLQLSSGDLKLSGELKGEALTSKPAISGNLKLAELNLRKWLEGLGLPVPETADASVLGRIGGDVTLKSKGNATEISSINLVLDDSKITGNGQLQGSAVAFKLAIDAIDVDRYLPPEGAAEAAPAKESKATGDEPLLPVEMLRSLNLNGEITIGELIIKKFKAAQVIVKVKAKGGKISLDQGIGKIYEGSYKGRIDLNVAGKTPTMKIEKHLKDVAAGPLLKDMLGEERLLGKGQFNTAITSRGNSVNAIKRGLNGKLDFRFDNGAVKGFNLAQSIREAKAKFSGTPAPKSDQPQQTDFSELSGSGVFKNGVLNNQDLLAKSPYLRVTGAGTVNLVNETLDYLVKAVVVSTDKGQGGEGLDDLKGVPIPVKLTGPLAAPSFSVDWGKVLTGTQKAKLEEKKAEVKEKVEEKVRDKLKGFFK